MSDVPVPAVVQELTGLAHEMSMCVAAWGRLRFAVTPEERGVIREYMLEVYGKDYGRILNVPLVVDPEGSKPELKFELNEDSDWAALQQLRKASP